ncbi:hypothetical protein FOZ62_029868 [Perkinsus olseni]|uniref:C3H1-type domain-containing protein n=1 Tax=Perkinsus olseni TaxID=32597 RepID=A0A7J6PXU5_PEROL|nr:hypothetical protein FOZ62_029868 [Perkinsus olseni]
MQPSIRNTFLSFEEAGEVRCERRQKKTRSMPAKSTCDRQQLALTSLLYRSGVEPPQVTLQEADPDEPGNSSSLNASIYHLNPLALLKSDSNSTCSNAVHPEPLPSPKAAHSLHKRKGWPSHLDLQGLSEHHRNTLLMSIPHDPETDEVLSCGSIPHSLGTCRPCVFARNLGRPCQYGHACLYCHYQHETKKRVRKTRKQRAEAKLLSSAQQLSSDIETLDDEDDGVSPRPSEAVVEAVNPEEIYKDLMDSVMLVCAKNLGIRRQMESS